MPLGFLGDSLTHCEESFVERADPSPRSETQMLHPKLGGPLGYCYIFPYWA